MHDPNFKTYLARVEQRDPVAGTALVSIPAALGAGSVPVSRGGIPLHAESGEYLIPDIGESVFVRVTHDFSQVEWTFDPVASMYTAANTADIATNTADISTNTADIATNTADTATNTADISTNTAGIAALQAAEWTDWTAQIFDRGFFDGGDAFTSDGTSNSEYGIWREHEGHVEAYLQFNVTGTSTSTDNPVAINDVNTGDLPGYPGTSSGNGYMTGMGVIGIGNGNRIPVGVVRVPNCFLLVTDTHNYVTGNEWMGRAAGADRTGTESAWVRLRLSWPTY